MKEESILSLSASQVSAISDQCIMMGLVNVITTATGLALAASCFVSGTAAAACPPVRPQVPSAVIPQGTIKGFQDEYCNSVFLGIPFAATTGGDNR